MESLSSSTATEYPEAQEGGWGDKELSAFLSTPDQVMQALSDSGAGPSQQAAVPSLTTQYLQHFENAFRQSRRAVIASTPPPAVNSVASVQPQAAPLGVAGLNPAYWQGLPAAPLGHSWPQQPQEQRATNPWVTASAHPYYQRPQQGHGAGHAAALAAHQAAQYQAQLQEQQTAQYVAQHAANMLGSTSAMHPDSEAFAQLAAALGLGAAPQAQLEALMRMQGNQQFFQGQMQGQMPVANIQGTQSVTGVQQLVVPQGVQVFGNYQQQLPGGQALQPSPADEEMDAEPSSFESADPQPTLVAAPLAPTPALAPVELVEVRVAPSVAEAMPHSITLAQQCSVAAKQMTPQLPPTQLLYRVMVGNGATHLINEVTDEDLHNLIVDELPELSRELAPPGSAPHTVPHSNVSPQSVVQSA